MQIVIEIPDRFVKDHDGLFIDDVYKATQEVKDAFFESVLKGTLLPEHHDDLVERNSFEYLHYIHDAMDGKLTWGEALKKIRYSAPTIIPATERSNNADSD